MSPRRHKFKILKTITLLRNQVAELFGHGHIEYSLESMDEVERHIDTLIKEVERKALVKK